MCKAILKWQLYTKYTEIKRNATQQTVAQSFLLPNTAVQKLTLVV